MTTLFILNHAPYGTEHCYNALRLAGALPLKRDEGTDDFPSAETMPMLLGALPAGLRPDPHPNCRRKGNPLSADRPDRA